MSWTQTSQKLNAHKALIGYQHSAACLTANGLGCSWVSNAHVLSLDLSYGQCGLIRTHGMTSWSKLLNSQTTPTVHTATKALQTDCKN